MSKKLGNRITELVRKMSQSDLKRFFVTEEMQTEFLFENLKKIKKSIS